MQKVKISSSILKSKIMIVDDSAISRRKLHGDLAGKGFTSITEADSGLSCLELLKTITPDLFLIDMLMPGMNGDELVKVLREDSKYTETPIIIVTVCEEEELIKKCFTLGANDFLRKPWDADELSTRAVSQLERLGNIAYLRESNTRLSRALEVIKDGIWECNIDTGELSLSPSCYRILNTSEDEVINIEYIASLVNQTDLQRITKIVNRAFRANKTSFDFECRIDLEDNSHRWISTRAKVIDYSSNGHPKIIVGVSKDITPQIIAQRHLQRFGKEMRELAEERSKIIIHSERLSALGIMSAGIAHEINNPLSYIKGNIQLLMKSIPLIFQKVSTEIVSDNIREELFSGLENIDCVLSSLEDGVRRVCDITSTMKNFSSNNADAAKIQDIATAIDDALLLCHNNLKNGVKVIKEYNADEFLLPINLQEITQVLINLITNAVHAMRGTGTIKIRTKRVGDVLHLEVEDTGPGMPEEVRENVFKAFYTTKKAGEGTGLGLYISKSIISEHRGSISVRNGEKSGTTFEICLPFINPPEDTNDPDFELSSNSGKPELLIAEEDIVILEIIIQKLKALDCKTIVASSTDSTISKIFENKPEAVLLSLSMSTPEGIFEILKKLDEKETYPKVFIIESKKYFKFPLERLKNEIDIKKFKTLKIIDVDDLSDAFHCKV